MMKLRNDLDVMIMMIRQNDNTADQLPGKNINIT